MKQKSRLKRRYKIIILLSILFCGYWIYLSTLDYVAPDKENIEKRINYLERIIHEPLNKQSKMIRLGDESLEFMLFTYAYSTYAFTNLITTDSTYTKRLAPLIKECINKALSPTISYPYSITQELLLSDSIPDYSVLYLGHLNLMLGCYRLVSDDSTFNQLNDNISSSLFNRYTNRPFMCLESYPKAIWIPDNTVALASLKLHSMNTQSDYDTICSQWIEHAKEKFIDTELNVLCSTVDPLTGEAKEEPRGSMLGWSIIFIYQFDSQFSLDLYNNYKEHFSDNLLALRLFRERANSRMFNIGDIDSGPIFLGYSIPANEFALGPAIIAGDYKTAGKIKRLINIGASKNEKNNELKYKVRFIDMNISPMAEALVLNSMTIIKWEN